MRHLQEKVKNRKKNNNFSSKYITTIYTLAHDRNEPAAPQTLHYKEGVCVYHVYREKDRTPGFAVIFLHDLPDNTADIARCM